tara:strand:+ start:117 stop:980 length:864 start_codon:yes stop_codon:yes gene_type:complete
MSKYQTIIDKLIESIPEANKNKSSYWRTHLPENSDFLNPYKNFGFSAYTKKSFKDFLYNILTKKIFGNDVFKTETYKAYKNIFDQINRYVDGCTIRHILSFEKLKTLIRPKKICIIGDGKLNGVLGAYLTFPEAKFFSVNLPEVLINDYIILDKTNISLKNSVEVVEGENFKSKEKLTLIQSNKKDYLLNKDIDLFINIASFQEMTITEIEKYFNIIKNNKSKLYCCNREYKKLSGGEELYFDNYPFSDAKKIFWENCPWHQHWYSLRPPFVNKYDGNIKHCLVEFL